MKLEKETFQSITVTVVLSIDVMQETRMKEQGFALLPSTKGNQRRHSDSIVRKR
jgi:hypothetical protein